jgi:Zn-finger protein
MLRGFWIWTCHRCKLEKSPEMSKTLKNRLLAFRDWNKDGNQLSRAHLTYTTNSERIYQASTATKL